MADVLREYRLANYQGFETVQPDGRTKREWKVVRGNGVLTLTATELRFARFVPAKAWVIPLDAVVSVERGRSHNGKWSGIPVLKVRFADDDGERIFGLLVGRRRETDAWVEAIRGAVAAQPRT